ncbi:unnamed protein product [Camellia sinensis]
MALPFLSVSGRPSASLISCLAAPPAPPPPNSNPTALPSLTCALQCPHFQSCSGCTQEYNLHRPIILDEAADFFNKHGVFDFTFDTCRLWGWRCRAKLAVRGSSTDPLIGLYQEGTHNVVDIPDCKAHNPNISAAVELLKQGIAELNVEPYDEDQGTGELRYVQMVVTTYNTSLPYAERYRNGKVQVALKLSTTLDEVSVYPIPAALYLVKNLLQYYIFAYVYAPGYQILKNLNIISTGVLYQIILKKNSDRVMALLSGFAGVYTETLTIRQSSFGSKCELSQEFLKKVSKSGIVESLLSWADFKIYVQMQAAKRSQTHLPFQVNDDRIILGMTLTDQVSIWKSSRGLTDKVVLDPDCSGETCTYYQIGDVFVCEKTGQVHVCDDTCREAVLDPTNEVLVCTISGHCFDRLLSPAEMEPDTVDSVVYLVDAYDKERFAEAKNELDALLSDDSLANVPFLILRNKIDMPYAASEDELRYYLGLTGVTTIGEWKKQANVRSHLR